MSGAAWVCILGTARCAYWVGIQRRCVPGEGWCMSVHGCAYWVQHGASTGSVLHAVPCIEAPVCGLSLTMQANGPADSLLPKDG